MKTPQQQCLLVLAISGIGDFSFFFCLQSSHWWDIRAIDRGVYRVNKRGSSAARHSWELYQRRNEWIIVNGILSQASFGHFYCYAIALCPHFIDYQAAPVHREKRRSFLGWRRYESHVASAIPRTLTL